MADMMLRKDSTASALASETSDNKVSDDKISDDKTSDSKGIDSLAQSLQTKQWLEEIFTKLRVGLLVALPDNQPSNLMLPGLPFSIWQDERYQQFLNHYIDCGVQPSHHDQEQSLSFSQHLYKLLAQQQAETSENMGFRCRILMPPLDLPSDQLRGDLDNVDFQAIQHFLDRQYFASGNAKHVSPIEYRIGEAARTSSLSPTLQTQDCSALDCSASEPLVFFPTIEISRTLQDRQFCLAVDAWMMGNSQPVHLSLAAWPLEQFGSQVTALYALMIVFIVDWYYLQLNLLYQPKLLKLAAALPKELSRVFSSEQLQIVLPEIRSLRQRNQAIVFCLQGNRAAEFGLWDNAIANYEIALELKPDFVDVLVAKGIARYQIGNYDRAIFLFDQVLAQQPAFSQMLYYQALYYQALYYRGMALAKSGRTLEALHSFETLTRYQPQSAEAWYEIGNLLHQSHRYLEAMRSFNRVLALQPDFTAAIHHRDQASGHYWLDWQLAHWFDEPSAVLALQMNQHSKIATIGMQSGKPLLEQRVLPQGRILQRLDDHVNWIHAIAISPNQEWAAVSSAEKQIELWAIDQRQVVCQLLGHYDWVNAVVFNPDSSILASGSSDRTVQLWSVATGQLLQSLEGHRDWVSALAFSRDGQYLASGSNDGSIKLWSDSSWQAMQQNMTHYKTAHPTTHHNKRHRYSANLWQFPTELESTLGWMIQPDGIWRELQNLTGHTGAIRSIALSPDSQYCASASQDGTVRLWQVSSGELVQTLLGHAGAVHSVTFSPDGLFLASGGVDGTIQIWSVATGKALRKLHGHCAAVDVLLFSADGESLISGGHDRQVCLWIHQVGSAEQGNASEHTAGTTRTRPIAF